MNILISNRMVKLPMKVIHINFVRELSPFITFGLIYLLTEGIINEAAF